MKYIYIYTKYICIYIDIYIHFIKLWDFLWQSKWSDIRNCVLLFDYDKKSFTVLV